MSQSTNANKKYAYLLNDIIEFARSYNDNKDIKVKATTVKLLYSQLICYGNSKMWNLPFKLSLRDLQSLTSCKPQTISSARDELKRRGKIFFANLDDSTYYTFPDKSGNPIITDENFKKIHETRNQDVINVMLSNGNPTVTQESLNGNPTVTQESLNGNPTVTQESLNGNPTVTLGYTVRHFDQMPLKASNQPKTNFDNSPPTTTTTPTSTPTSTPISINLLRQEPKTPKSTDQTDETQQKNFSTTTTTSGGEYNKNVIEENQNEEPKNSETGLIDRLTFLKEKKEGNLGAQGLNGSKQNADSNSNDENFDGLCREFGNDTVNQALFQVKKQEQRTGRTDLSTNYKYLRTTCQKILGMKPPDKPKHESKSRGEGNGFLPPPQSSVIFDDACTIIKKTNPKLIKSRYHIVSDAFDRFFPNIIPEYQTPEKMAEILMTELKNYAEMGMYDEDYLEEKKARGNK